MYNLYIWHWQSKLLTDITTDSWLMFCRQSMVNVLAECWPLYQVRYLLAVSWYVDHHSANISVDISVDMSTNISRSLYRTSVGQYVDWHISWVLVDMSGVSQYVDWYIGWGVHKIHMIRKLQVSILSIFVDFIIFLFYFIFNERKGILIFLWFNCLFDHLINIL